MSDSVIIPARDVCPGMVIAFRAIRPDGTAGECEYHTVTRCQVNRYNGHGHDTLTMHSEAGHSAEYSLVSNMVHRRIMPLKQLELFGYENNA